MVSVSTILVLSVALFAADRVYMEFIRAPKEGSEQPMLFGMKEREAAQELHAATASSGSAGEDAEALNELEKIISKQQQVGRSPGEVVVQFLPAFFAMSLGVAGVVFAFDLIDRTEEERQNQVKEKVY